MRMGLRAVSSVWPYFWPYSSLLARAARAKAYRNQEEPFCWLEWSLGQDICLLCKLEDSPHKPQWVKEEDSPPGTRRSLSVGDLSLGMKADPSSLCQTCCTTKEELALWKPGRKLSGSRHVGTAQGLAQERRILCVLLLSSLRLPGSNSSPHGKMQCSSPGSGSGRRVGAERCCFCAVCEGYWEGVKCQSVVMAFLPTCVVDVPAVLLTFPQCLVWNQISAWLQDHYDCQLIFYIIYLWRWILQLLWVL